MTFTPTLLPGAFIIGPERFSDERGFYARLWDQREFESRGLNPRIVQCDVAFNHKAGTLRGMHLQIAPHAQVKLVRCTGGAIYDVIIDLRPDSPTFTKHIGVELTAENHQMLYVPEGFAHGYLTLRDNTEVAYQMSDYYAPQAGSGVRWDDPVFGIQWPGEVKIILERDRKYPDFKRS